MNNVTFEINAATENVLNDIYERIGVAGVEESEISFNDLMDLIENLDEEVLNLQDELRAKDDEIEELIANRGRYEEID